MDLEREMIRLEDQRWADLQAVVNRIPEERMTEVGVTPEWSVKDLLAHLGCWMAEAASTLERMRLGTYEPAKLDFDAINAEFHAASKDADLQSVKAALQSGRTRMLQEWSALPEVTPAAEEWFRDSGPGHVDEHIADLERFEKSLDADTGPGS